MSSRNGQSALLTRFPSQFGRNYTVRGERWIGVRSEEPYITGMFRLRGSG